MRSFFETVLFTINAYEFTVYNVFFLVFSLIGLPLLSNFIHRLLKYYFDKHEISQKEQSTVQSLFRFVFYLFAAFLIMSSLGLHVPSALNYPIIQLKNYEFTPVNILTAIFIIGAGRLALWIIFQALGRYYAKGKYDLGTQFAINKILKYFIYTIAILSAIQSLGINLTVIWAGAAALMVGFGLGLQQTFNDLASGIFLLLERGVHVGDVLEVGELTGKVKNIGMRASEIVTRDGIVILVPNSKLVTETVVNWYHNTHNVRHRVSVGVAYGSNTKKVKGLLRTVVDAHDKVLQDPEPLIRFIGFGDSSLDFEILFWSTEFVNIEDVKSDIRYEIDEIFRQNGITIPFPQRDVWFKNPIASES